MLVKIHKSYREIVAVCDKDLLRRHFEEGERILDIRENFFNGEEMEEDAFIKLAQDRVKEDATFFIAGKQSIGAALKSGIIKEEGIKTVQEVPFALVLL